MPVGFVDGVPVKLPITSAGGSGAVASTGAGSPNAPLGPAGSDESGPSPQGWIAKSLPSGNDSFVFDSSAFHSAAAAEGSMDALDNHALGSTEPALDLAELAVRVDDLTLLGSELIDLQFGAGLSDWKI